MGFGWHPDHPDILPCVLISQRLPSWLFQGLFDGQHSFWKRILTWILRFRTVCSGHFTLLREGNWAEEVFRQLIAWKSHTCTSLIFLGQILVKHWILILFRQNKRVLYIYFWISGSNWRHFVLFCFLCHILKPKWRQNSNTASFLKRRRIVE